MFRPFISVYIYIYIPIYIYISLYLYIYIYLLFTSTCHVCAESLALWGFAGASSGPASGHSSWRNEMRTPKGTGTISSSPKIKALRVCVRISGNLWRPPSSTPTMHGRRMPAKYIAPRRHDTDHRKVRGDRAGKRAWQPLPWKMPWTELVNVETLCKTGRLPCANMIKKAPSDGTTSFMPKTFLISQSVYPKSLYTGSCLHHKAFSTRRYWHPKTLFHQKPFTPEGFVHQTPETLCITKLLHQNLFAPQIS